MIQHKTIAAAAAAFTLGATAHAGTVVTHADGKTSKETKDVVEEKGWCDTLWDIPVLYKNKDNPYVQEFRLIGRWHADVYHLDSDQGYEQDWISRRLRAGFQMKFLQQFEAKFEISFNPQLDTPAYDKITDAYLAWKPMEALRIAVGKQGVKFTQEGATSSNELLTIDRSNLANNLWFTEEYAPGVNVSGKFDSGLLYSLGVYSGGSSTKEFGNFDAGWFGAVSVGYDFSKAVGFKKAVVRADYVYNQRDAESTFTRQFENIGSINLALEQERWGVLADVSAGQGFNGQGEVFGFMVMPFFNICKNLQAVARYTYLTSDSETGIRLARYDNAITRARGDEYQEIYGGLNYYICGHKLKLQTGISYETLKGATVPGGEYHAVQWTSGLRFSF